MDVGDKDKLEDEKRNVSNHTPGLLSDWPCGSADFANLSMDLISPASSFSSMVDSYGLLLPTADSAFVERAAQISYFNPGNIADLMNSFAMSQPVSPYNHLITPMSYGPHALLMDAAMHGVPGGEPQNNEINLSSASMDVSLSSSDHRKQERSPQIKDTSDIDEAKQAKSDESDIGHDGTEPSPSKEFGAKKRKRVGKLSGEDATDNSIQNSPLKECSKASDPPKEDYIHVRARRGQATNSHSLAERVRREKIRERMKFLQDLVPGCSKVTGKAVMLDEIINYVQSLQRQVEFLSMKLATVDHRMDFNIARLLAKDKMCARQAAQSSLGLSPHMLMAYPPVNSSHQSLPIIGSSSDALRNLDYHLTSLHEGYKEHPQQMPNVWDDELQNVVQMGFSPSTPVDNQETPKNSSLPTGHMKVEL